jgi:hypothetical protein
MGPFRARERAVRAAEEDRPCHADTPDTSPCRAKIRAALGLYCARVCGSRVSPMALALSGARGLRRSVGRGGRVLRSPICCRRGTRCVFILRAIRWRTRRSTGDRFRSRFAARLRAHHLARLLRARTEEHAAQGRKRWIDAPFASSSRVNKARVPMAALSLSISASPSGPALARARMASSSRSSISVTLLGWPREPPCFLRCWRSSLRRADVTLTPGSGCSRSTR